MPFDFTRYVFVTWLAGDISLFAKSPSFVKQQQTFARVIQSSHRINTLPHSLEK